MLLSLGAGFGESAWLKLKVEIKQHTLFSKISKFEYKNRLTSKNFYRLLR